jgi:hypothetical protein
MSTCTICQAQVLTTRAERATKVCRECAKVSAILPLPPPTRPAVPCMRCQHTALIRVVPRELSAGGQDYVEERIAPMTVTYAPHTVKRLLFGGQQARTPTPAQGAGVLEAWICEACGFVEWYCQDPKSVPVGPEFNSERHVVPSPGFRG